MNGYKCFGRLRGRLIEIEVEAKTSYQAQQEAATLSGIKRQDITVVLCEKDANGNCVGTVTVNNR